MNSKINPFPPMGRGLWRVKREPYPMKEMWTGAPFGDRWRAIKARWRSAPTAMQIAQERPR